jgi:ACT domain-containing protein
LKTTRIFQSAIAIANQQSQINNPQMANEDLIYRITRAVYERLGPSANEQMVEQLVTDIYREVKSTVTEPARTETSASPSGSSERMIISVFGMDHPGIVAAVSQILADAGCSIIDINQTVVQGKFAMVIIGDTSRARESTAELKERLRRAGEQLGVRIYAQREDLFNAMHRV